MGSTLAQCATLLRRDAAFVSGDAEAAHRAIAAALNKHRVAWGRGAVDTALHCKSVGSLKLIFLRYGPAVTIERQEGDFYVVQAALRGRALFGGRGAGVTIGRRTGAVLSPRSRGVLEWSEGCEQVLIKVPLRAVEQAWRTLTGAALKRPPEFAPALALDGTAGAWFLHLVDCALRDEQLAAPRGAGAQLARRLEELFVLKLLTAQPHSLSDTIGRLDQRVGPKSVRRAEEYMRAHLDEPLSLPDLARHARVSARSLHKAFHDFRGTSPMAVLRAMRLDAAHGELAAAAPGERVGDIALRWGFAHLGRFAGHYRRRFGTTPAATLRH